MDSNAIKKVILILIIMIVVLVVLIQQLFATKKIMDKEQTEIEKQQQEQIKEEEEINKNTITGIKETKIYNSLISKIDNNNMYIDMQINRNANMIVALKDGKIYIETPGGNIISRENNVYIINNEQKIISEKKDSKIEIRQIINIPSLENYNTIKIKQGKEIIEDKEYHYEIVDNLQYYFENEELKYIKDIEQNDLYAINSVTEIINDEIFNLPLEYGIIDGSTIDINSMIK